MGGRVLLESPVAPVSRDPLDDSQLLGEERDGVDVSVFVGDLR